MSDVSLGKQIFPTSSVHNEGLRGVKAVDTSNGRTGQRLRYSTDQLSQDAVYRRNGGASGRGDRMLKNS